MKEHCSILVVDDNKLTCWGLEKVISAHELLVSTVNNGRDAISEIGGAQFCAVFLDINLPDISGFEVLREIKNVSPGTKVIMMTADNTDGNRKRAMESGAAHFMGKPFSIPEIREVLRDIVDIGNVRKII